MVVHRDFVADGWEQFIPGWYDGMNSLPKPKLHRFVWYLNTVFSAGTRNTTSDSIIFSNTFKCFSRCARFSRISPLVPIHLKHSHRCRIPTAKVLSNLTGCMFGICGGPEGTGDFLFHHPFYLFVKAAFQLPTFLGLPRGLAVTCYEVCQLNKDNRL
jgi:hypothetical protein